VAECSRGNIITAPEVAAVGLTTREAERAGRRVEVVDYDITDVAGAHQ
jgi:pyruvate/2-oxoglutarate dehydrogenase complex dihydrolipoamide dehydrogenase (E3) component